MDLQFEHADELVEAAIDAFSEHGYKGASINAILQRAGMSKGQFYHHFGNKQGLYVAIAGLMVRRKQEFMARSFDASVLDGDIFDLLGAQLALSSALQAAHPDLQRFSVSFMREKGTPVFEAVMSAHGAGSQQGLRELIQAAHARGDFRSDLPAEFVVNVMIYLFSNVVDLTSLDTVKDTQATLAHLITFLKSGLAAPAADKDCRADPS